MQVAYNPYFAASRHLRHPATGAVVRDSAGQPQRNPFFLKGFTVACPQPFSVRDRVNPAPLTPGDGQEHSNTCEFRNDGECDHTPQPDVFGSH